jgi:hypothetical protein
MKHWDLGRFGTPGGGQPQGLCQVLYRQSLSAERSFAHGKQEPPHFVRRDFVAPKIGATLLGLKPLQANIESKSHLKKKGGFSILCLEPGTQSTNREI